jgi:hypothetical protein
MDHALSRGLHAADRLDVDEQIVSELATETSTSVSFAAAPPRCSVV